jgi:tRNA(Ile)-lysidine synthase TilS/MesJ
MDDAPHTLLVDFPANAKCTRCRAHPSVRLVSHHAIFCTDCFLGYFRNAVRRAMRKFQIPAQSPLMVAVSGGKDSLALWDVLHHFGYATHGLHLNLGIDRFSEVSAQAVARFAQARGLPWSEYSLEKLVGFPLPDIRRRTRRPICSLCGTLKRQLLNRLSLAAGPSVLCIGHNLDDEAGRLLGNLVRHRTQYLDKQQPFLPSVHPRLPAKAKPLYRLEAAEILTYCQIAGITPITEPCPFARGATSHAFQRVLGFLERTMPGTKRDFLFTFLKHRPVSTVAGTFGTCLGCGEPTYEDLCGVCRLRSQLEGQSATTNPNSDLEP